MGVYVHCYSNKAAKQLKLSIAIWETPRGLMHVLLHSEVCQYSSEEEVWEDPALWTASLPHCSTRFYIHICKFI